METEVPSPRPERKPSASAGGFVVPGVVVQPGETDVPGGGETSLESPGTPIIGLAHGSRQPHSGTAIAALMEAVAERSGVDSRPAFLDLASPDLETTARQLAAQGYRSAVVVPLLFTVAFHARVDTPEAVRQAERATGLTLLVTDILGVGEDMAQLQLERLAQAQIEDQCSVLLYAVGSSDPDANRAVIELASRLSDVRSGAVAAAFATTDPKPDAVLSALPEPVAVLPLFLADGLLLNSIRTQAVEQGWDVVEPIGVRAADIVLRRYASVGEA